MTGRDKTRDALWSALLRLKNRKAKINYTTVAKEAGVERPLLNSTYPDVMREIDQVIGRAKTNKQDKLKTELAATKAQLKQARADLKKAEADLRSIASINMTLQAESDMLRAQSGGKVSLLTVPTKRR